VLKQAWEARLHDALPLVALSLEVDLEIKRVKILNGTAHAQKNE
jgi:hypothetical protein